MKRCATAVFLAFALGGCANLSWQKADTDRTQTERDLDQCQHMATAAARRLGSAMGPQTPVIVASPNGPVTVIPPGYNAASDPFAQQSLLARCMHERGYELVREK